MHEIVESIRRVTDIVGEITAASQEQTSGIEQINTAIAQMDEVTQQNASLVEEAAAASEAMQDQAATLEKLVGVFKLGGTQAIANGASRTRSAPSSQQMKGAPSVKKTNTVRIAQHDTRTAAVRPKRLAAVPPETTGGDWEEF